MSWIEVMRFWSFDADFLKRWFVEFTDFSRRIFWVRVVSSSANFAEKWLNSWVSLWFFVEWVAKFCSSNFFSFSVSAAIFFASPAFFSNYTRTKAYLSPNFLLSPLRLLILFSAPNKSLPFPSISFSFPSISPFLPSSTSFPSLTLFPSPSILSA